MSAVLSDPKEGLVSTIADLLLKLLDPLFRGWRKQREFKTLLEELNPIEVLDGEEVRLFSWRGRGAVHLVEVEHDPRQLMEFFIPLCEALRRESGMEPQFDLPDVIRGEIVYELSSDLKAKWRVLGGDGGRPAEQVLVLVPKD
jgi:hypothetical protein